MARPIGNFKGSSDYHYQTLRCNVDVLRMIQLGLTLCDEQGNLPPEVSTWQFNLHFNVDEDMCAPDSLELLTKAGLDFERHSRFGIDHETFGEMLITSGLILFDDVRWISFHSGYDFGYMLKLVTNAPLPAQENEFFEVLHRWFPCVYDVKYLMRSCKSLKGGLQDVADDLRVSRIGQQHQAGSDSLLTAFTFFKLRDRFFDGMIDDAKYLYVACCVRADTQGLHLWLRERVERGRRVVRRRILPGAGHIDARAAACRCRRRGATDTRQRADQVPLLGACDRVRAAAGGRCGIALPPPGADQRSRIVLYPNEHASRTSLRSPAGRGAAPSSCSLTGRRAPASRRRCSPASRCWGSRSSKAR